MNTVEPIRDIALVKDIASYLKKESDRNHVLFMFGIYSGLRISDILKMQARDVKGKKYIYIREQKTGKEKRFPINKVLSEILEDYTKEMPEYEYLFQTGRDDVPRPITRQQAYNILSSAGEKFGLQSIGTHTLRKTFGYHMYQQTHDLVTIKEIMNHSDISVTMRYIGITQDIKDNAIKSLTF